MDEVSGAWHYRVPHNSVDFTAMVHIAENPGLFAHVKQWFYLHDTTSVGLVACRPQTARTRAGHIQALVRQQDAETTSKETLYIARTAMGKIIGKNGARIKLIRSSSRCSITIDQPDADDSPVTCLLEGKPRSLVSVERVRGDVRRVAFLTPPARTDGLPAHPRHSYCGAGHVQPVQLPGASAYHAAAA